VAVTMFEPSSRWSSCQEHQDFGDISAHVRSLLVGCNLLLAHDI
jgi:hypothetical protein